MLIQDSNVLQQLEKKINTSIITALYRTLYNIPTLHLHYSCVWTTIHLTNLLYVTTWFFQCRVQAPTFHPLDLELTVF